MASTSDASPLAAAAAAAAAAADSVTPGVTAPDGVFQTELQSMASCAWPRILAYAKRSAVHCQALADQLQGGALGASMLRQHPGGSGDVIQSLECAEHMLLLRCSLVAMLTAPDGCLGADKPNDSTVLSHHHHHHRHHLQQQADMRRWLQRVVVWATCTCVTVAGSAFGVEDFELTKGSETLLDPGADGGGSCWRRAHAICQYPACSLHSSMAVCQAHWGASRRRNSTTATVPNSSSSCAMDFVGSGLQQEIGRLAIDVLAK
jgi:hypothetical protein